MYIQASLGDVDFITGDYLAEVNIAQNAQAHAAGKHPGWEQTAWDGIEQTIDLLNKKRIKVVVNGGAHNPQGLAEKVQELVHEPLMPFVKKICSHIQTGKSEKLQPKSRIRARR